MAYVSRIILNLEIGTLSSGDQLSIHRLPVRADLCMGHQVVGDTMNWIIKQPLFRIEMI